jgi:hypothetical protein
MSAVLCISGCSGDSEMPKVKVKGVVTYNGDVLSEGAIKFSPISGDGPTTGAVIEEGNYSAEVPPAPMRVEITSPRVTGTRKAYDTPDSPMVDITEEMIPARYNTKTELKFDAADATEGDFDLKRDPK